MWHNVIFGFRVFNSFLGKTTSGLSAGAIAVPIILTAIISAIVGFPFVVPLIVTYSVVAAIALVAGICFGAYEYKALTDQENRILNRYDLKIDTHIPDPTNIPCKQVILVKVKGEGSIYTAYFKWPISPVSADIPLTPKETEFIENNNAIPVSKEIKKNHPLVNQIIHKAILTTNALQKEKLSPEQKKIQVWESINAFLENSPTIFAIASFIIFLITTVFFGAVIPGAFLIAVGLSIAYGVFSAFVKNAELDSRFWQIQGFKKQFDDDLANADLRISYVLERIDTTNNRIDRANNLLGENLFEKDSAEEESFEDNLTLIQQKQQELATTRTYLGSLRGRLQANEAFYFGFTKTDILKIGVFGLVFGGISAASFIYVALPLLISALGFPPLSLPILAAIVVVAGLAYGLSYMYHTANSIKQEKWENIDNEEFTEVDQLLKSTLVPAESLEEEELETQLQELEKRLRERSGKELILEDTPPLEKVEDHTNNIQYLARTLAEQAQKKFTQIFGDLNNEETPLNPTKEFDNEEPPFNPTKESDNESLSL